MLRLSSYSVLSEPLSSGGYALLNGCTGAVDLLSEELGRILKAALLRNDCNPHPGHPGKQRYKHAVSVPAGEIPAKIVDDFMDRGHFTRLSHAEERAHVARVAGLLHEVAQIQPHFLIVPNLDCNYRCTYCFERPIQNRLKTKTSEINYSKGNVVMRPAHIAAIFKAIEQIRTTARNRPVWNDLEEAGSLPDEQTGAGLITLYGGEPLDAANKEIVFEIVNRGVARGHAFAAITNGHDLDQFLPVLGEEKISQVQITIDGPKRVHDKSRLARDRQSSFDRIIRNVRIVLDHGGVEVQLRCHVDSKNLHLFSELLEVFEAERWLNHEKVVVYASNYHVKDKEGRVTQAIDYGNVLKRWQETAARYRNLHISGIGVHADRMMMPALKSKEPARLKGTYCGANSGTYIFAADGFIYACWESVGKKCSKIGNYVSEAGLALDQGETGRWFNRSVAKIPECLDCCYALVCGGGCAQYAEYNDGTLYKPYCDEFEVVYPAALAKTVGDHLGELGVPSAAVESTAVMEPVLTE